MVKVALLLVSGVMAARILLYSMLGTLAYRNLFASSSESYLDWHCQE